MEEDTGETATEKARPGGSGRRLGLQIAVGLFTAFMLVIVAFALEGASTGGAIFLVLLVVMAALALAGSAAVVAIGKGEFPREDPPAQPIEGKRKLRWVLAAGLPATPVVGLSLTFVFMRQPPSSGPWTRWDLVSFEDLVFWVVISAIAWSLVVLVVAAVRYRGTSLEAPLLLCAVPGLFMLGLFPAVRKAACPSQFPRGDMLEPLPPGTDVIHRGQSTLRGSGWFVVEIDSPTQPPNELERSAAEHYLSQGWELASDDGYTVELVAGEWELSIGDQYDYQAPGGPEPLGVQLAMWHSDGDCDWLS